MKLIIGNKAYSSWSLRGWLACKQSGLPFEEQVVPLYDAAWEKRRQGDEFAPSSGKVPILWDDGLVVWDSLAIIEFLAERAGADKFWPADEAARAMARHFGVAKSEARAYLERAADMDPRQVAGRLLSDAMCRRWVDDVAEYAPGTVWQAELVASDTRPAYHASELAPAFGRTDDRSAVDNPDTAETVDTADTTSGSPLFAWLTRFVRTGEVGWRPYREAGSITDDRTALRVALDGTGAHEVADPLGYLRGVFAPVVREY